MTFEYDEQRLYSRLASADVFTMTAVATATAERMFPLFVLGARLSDHVRSSGLLRAELDELWNALETGHLRDGADPANAAVALVPSADDPGWTDESAFMQNAAAATAYAARVWKSGDPQDAVWALRQAVEAADYAVQSSTDTLTEPWWSAALVQEVIAAIESDLAVAKSGPEALATLRAASASASSWGAELALAWTKG